MSLKPSQYAFTSFSLTRTSTRKFSKKLYCAVTVYIVSKDGTLLQHFLALQILQLIKVQHVYNCVHI